MKTISSSYYTWGDYFREGVCKMQKWPWLCMEQDEVDPHKDQIICITPFLSRNRKKTSNYQGIKTEALSVMHCHYQWGQCDSWGREVGLIPYGRLVWGEVKCCRALSLQLPCCAPTPVGKYICLHVVFTTRLCNPHFPTHSYGQIVHQTFSPCRWGKGAIAPL